jgi:hypothetical protein
MAIKVAGNTVISDTLQLQNIQDADAQSEATINNAVKNQNNILKIYDSAGVAIRVLYCATETPVV